MYKQKMSDSKIVIMRHGNRKDYENMLSWLLCGSGLSFEPQLSDNGIQNAHKTALELLRLYNEEKPTHIITSPWLRCLQTATIMKNYFPSAEIVIEPLLGEYEKKLENCLLYPQGRPTSMVDEHSFVDIDDLKHDYFERPETEETLDKRVSYITNVLKEKYPTSIWVTHKALLDKISKNINSSNKNESKLGYLSFYMFEKKGNKYDCTNYSDGIVTNLIRLYDYINKHFNYYNGVQ